MEFCIKKETKIGKGYKEQYIKGKFDLQGNNFIEEFKGNIEIENLDWNIGIIVGPSGTGKTTIAKEIFGENIIDLQYGDKSIIEELGNYGDINFITNIFNKVGFNTPKSWLKPYNVLSNGEKMRVDLANTLLQNKEISIFDEFTSVVDRQVAKVASYAVAKTIRKEKKKFIAVGCHYDILERLEPDWVFDTKDFVFIQGVRKPIKDPQSISELENETIMNGNYLVNIII